MIQRIQTVFLLIIVILAVLLLSGNLMKLSSQKSSVINIRMTEALYEGITGRQGNQVYILLYISLTATVTMTILSVVSIFLFKKRKLQYILTLIIVLMAFLETAFLAYLIYILSGIPGTEVIFGTRILIPPAIILFSILAARAIKHDENLIRSYDRLR